jgi:hypothetical protein
MTRRLGNTQESQGGRIKYNARHIDSFSVKTRMADRPGKCSKFSKLNAKFYPFWVVSKMVDLR